MLVLASAEAVAGITVAGALVVAVITAVTTNRRQREALKHDRELADLADLRKLLDEAAVVMNDAGDALDELLVRFMEHGAALPQDIREKVAQFGRDLDTLNARIRVRVGNDVPLTTSFQACVDAVHAGWRATRRLEDAESLVERREELQTITLTFRMSAGAFVEAAVERAGTAESS